MNERRRESDRRDDLRRPACGRVSWTKSSSDRTYLGWLSDQSSTSLSFLAGTSCRPSLDEQVVVMGPDRKRRSAQVARIAPFDDHVSLIACRAADAADQIQTTVTAGQGPKAHRELTHV